MPPTGINLTPHVCDVPDCTWGDDGGPARYKLAQHLGLHKLHKHGVKGASRKHPNQPPKKMGRPKGSVVREATPVPLSAADICAVVLKDVAPKGTIPIDAIDAYNEWVRQTEMFLGKLLG